jgi:hypothetical protein
MANRERGEVALKAGTSTYTLRLSFNAIAEIETLLDKGINDIAAMLRDADDFRIGTWRVMLWGALREFHPTTSLDDAGEIMGKAGVQHVIEALGDAMTLSFPEQGEGENPQKASADAGKTS